MTKKMTNNTKTCSTCKEPLPKENFCKNKRTFDGLNFVCFGCQRKHNNKYRVSEKGRVAQYNSVRRYVNTAKGLFIVYRNSSKRRKLEFSLTKEYFQSIFNKTVCIYCNDKIPTVSLDRIDNSRGYVRDNIAPCCGICNFMKQSLSQTDFFTHIKKIHENFSK